MRALPIRSKNDIPRALIAATDENRWYIERMAKAFRATDFLPESWESDGHQADVREQIDDLVEFVADPSGEPEDIAAVVASLAPATFKKKTVKAFVKQALTADGHIRKVRTEEGAKRFNLPVGSIIKTKTTWKKMINDAGDVLGYLTKDEHGTTVALQKHPKTGEFHTAVYDKHGKPLQLVENKKLDPHKWTDVQTAKDQAVTIMELHYAQKMAANDSEYTYDYKKNKEAVATIPTASEAPAAAPHISNQVFIKGKQKTFGHVNLDAKQGHPDHHVVKKSLADGYAHTVGDKVIDKAGNIGTVKQTYQTHTQISYDDPNLKTKTVANSSLNKHSGDLATSDDGYISKTTKLGSTFYVKGTTSSGDKATSVSDLHDGVFIKKYPNDGHVKWFVANDGKETEPYPASSVEDAKAQATEKYQSGKTAETKINLSDFIKSNSGKRYFGIGPEGKIPTTSLYVTDGVVVNQDNTWFAVKNSDIIHNATASGPISAMKDAAAWLEENHPEIAQQTNKAIKAPAKTSNTTYWNGVSSQPQQPKTAKPKTATLEEAMKAANEAVNASTKWDLPTMMKFDDNANLGSENNPVRFSVHASGALYKTYGMYLTNQDRNSWKRKSAYDMVDKYTGSYASLVNTWLWNEKSLDDAAEAKNVSNLNKAFQDQAVVSFPHWTILSRGAGIDDLHGLDLYPGASVDEIKKHVGKTFPGKGYKSTSLTDVPGLAAGAECRYIIKCPPGTQGVYAEFGQHPGEREVILPRGSTYRLLDAEVRQGGQKYITIELLPNTENK